MALTAISQDEITLMMADTYDGLLEQTTGKPMRIWRNNNNKLYLVFRAVAAGIKLLLDAVIALRNRFNPALCDDADLYAVAKLVGTEIKKGASSVLRIAILNESGTEQKSLSAGEYRYTSVSGIVFTFTCAAGLLFNPGEEKTVFAVSGEIGSHYVTRNDGITVFRSDGGPIDSSLYFSCSDNAGSLGYPDEDLLSFRQRILNDRLRQDAVKEVELKIRNLPGILECNLVFNQNNHTSSYDGLTLEPMELLVVITGSPSGEIAEIVASGVVYQTHAVNPEQVVYYRDACYIGGKYPVYYMFHGHTDFSLEITYRYDSQQQYESLIERTINGILEKFKNPSEYTETVNKETFYSALQVPELGGVKILNVDILAGGEAVPYLDIPRTRLPNLTDVSFIAVGIGGGV
jgi:hypothetical protein